MSFIPEEKSTQRGGMTMTPMIDFLFLMLAFFACLAVSRVTVRDTDINLVNVKAEPSAMVTRDAADTKVVKLNVSADNKYTWVTEIRDYDMNTTADVAKELALQYERGVLPADKNMTKVLLKIDEKAQWNAIMKLIFAVREQGFEVRPVYMPEEIADMG